jgi:hypothetical protein
MDEIILGNTTQIYYFVQKYLFFRRHQWHTPIILATQDTDIRTITVHSQPQQTVHETLF